LGRESRAISENQKFRLSCEGTDNAHQIERMAENRAMAQTKSHPDDGSMGERTQELVQEFATNKTRASFH
jgi:hypothetical protein